MKRLLFLLALVLPLLAGAQHMKFMGIPLDGTITAFQTKLKAKGVTYDAKLSKAIDAGSRAFRGRFFGRKADIFVYYNTKTKKVYRAKACIMNDDKDIILRWYKDLYDSLKAKYPLEYSEDAMHNGFDSLAILFTGLKNDSLFNIGEIQLYITNYQPYDWSDYDVSYTLHVDYVDYANQDGDTKANMDDL